MTSTTLIDELEIAADDAISTAEHLFINGGTKAAIQLCKNHADRLLVRIDHVEALIARYALAADESELANAIRWLVGSFVMTEIKYTQVELRNEENCWKVIFIPTQFAIKLKKLKINNNRWTVTEVYKTVDKEYLLGHYQAYKEFHEVLEEH